MAITPVRIKLDAGGEMVIEWSDGHAASYPHEYLRGCCPCATCKGAEGRTPSTGGSGPLPMFKPSARPLRAELVGRYALQVFWSDGHSTGIYTFPYLREICPCPECTQAREAAGE